MLSVGLPPALTGSEYKPVTHIGDLCLPPAVLLGLPFAASETVDDLSDLQKLDLRVLGVIGAGKHAFRAGAKLRLKITDFGIRGRLGLQNDVTPWIIINLSE